MKKRKHTIRRKSRMSRGEGGREDSG